jgi:hypothetical protein
VPGSIQPSPAPARGKATSFYLIAHRADRFNHFVKRRANLIIFVDRRNNIDITFRDLRPIKYDIFLKMVGKLIRWRYNR